MARYTHKLVFMLCAMLIVACGRPSAASVAPTNTESSESSAKPTSSAPKMWIGTGSVGGVYQPYGKGLAELLNTAMQANIDVKQTGGSVDNLKDLQAGTIQIGIATVDSAYDAYQGRGGFAQTGKVDVRTIAVLYQSYIHVVASANSGISKMADLKGKRISLGSVGSSSEVAAKRMLAAAGLDPDKDVMAINLGVSESSDALKSGDIDAFFWNGGLPTSAISDLISAGTPKIVFVPTGAYLQELRQEFGPLYTPLTPNESVYNGVAANVPGVGISNILIVNANMPDDQVYAILKAMFDNLDELHKAHPEAAKLTLQTAATGSSIPFHPGAIKFYTEHGVWKGQ